MSARNRPPAGPGNPGRPKDAAEDVIVEFHRVGHAVKVSAFDPATLTEVSIVGAANMTEAQLTQAVLRKLDYVLKRNNKR